MTDEWGENVRGFAIFGKTRRSEQDACSDSVLLVPFSSPSPNVFLAQLSGLFPTGGSPMGYALEQAARDFPERPGRKIIVLITDGEESCFGNSCELLRKLRSEQGIEATVNVVGFSLNPDFSRELGCVSEQSEGQLYNARSMPELMSGLCSAVSTTELGPITVPELNQGLTPAQLAKLDDSVKISTVDAPIPPLTLKPRWPPVTPLSAFFTSSVMPGVALFRLNKPVQGTKVFVTESALLGLALREISIDAARDEAVFEIQSDGSVLLESTQRGATPFEAWKKDLLVFGISTFHFSQMVGASLTVRNEMNKNSRKRKNPWKAAMKSFVIPGSGILYVGDDPEDGLEIMAFQGYFIYRIFHPVPSGVTFTAEQENQLKNINAQLAAALYGSQIVVSFIAATVHNLFASEPYARPVRTWHWTWDFGRAFPVCLTKRL